MVQIISRKVEAQPLEVFVEREGEVYAFPKKIDALRTKVQIDLNQYALVQSGDVADYALSIKQQLGGLRFDPMVAEALRKGLPLARVGDFTSYYRNVNMALRKEGVLYDASGNLIEGEKLAECGNAVNSAWVYLNDSFENSTSPTNKGFLGLDVVHIIGFDGEKTITERQPLEECVVDCWADVLGPINSQGYYKKVSPVQKFVKGETVFVQRPTSGSVARFVASPNKAYLVGYGFRDVADSWLGGFLCAEGTAQKNKEGSQ